MDSGACRALEKALGINSATARVLCRRGFATPDDAALYLDPRLATLSDPFLLPSMRPAVARILSAIDAAERIVLYGDYDVDGVTSVALLCRILTALGGNVSCFLPDRATEGYGLTQAGLARCEASFAPQLLIAVDCGTSSAKEIRELEARDISVIVLDHHECPEEVPRCAAFVNPKVGGDFGYLCSVGIAFKTAHALLKERRSETIDLRHYLDLAALGTIADLTPLHGENRVLVKRGLAQLASTRWIGLQALKRVSALQAPISSFDVGFRLAPRMNAAGRLGTAQDALELLLCEDPTRAAELAENLDIQNQERRSVEDAVFTEAERQLTGWYSADDHSAIVVGERGWHPGVVGIVASRLSKRYHRPTVVIGFDTEGVGKGSGRSIAGFSLVSALQHCGHLLEKHGGHEMAAGLTVLEPSFENLRETFLAHAEGILTPGQLVPTLHIDEELSLDSVTLTFLEEHDQLQPFGVDNPQPLFIAKQVTCRGEPRILKEKHFSFQLIQNGSQARAIWFGGAEDPLPPPPWDIAFTIERNEYLGRVTPQVQIKALRSSRV